MEKILAPSILSADFSHLGEDIRSVAEAGAPYIHIDVMDGMFVPSITIGMPVLASIRPVTDAVFDVHLMVQDPERYVTEFARLGADIITVHAEATRHLDRTLDLIHSLGKKAGVALNPATPLCYLDHVLDKLDMALLMTVNPGFGGQKYIPAMTEKIRELRRIFTEKGLEKDIEVDGGIGEGTIHTVLSAGANVLVAGSAVFDGKDAPGNVKKYLKILEEY